MLVGDHRVGERHDVGRKGGIRRDVEHDPGATTRRPAHRRADHRAGHLELDEEDVTGAEGVDRGHLALVEEVVGAGHDDDRVLPVLRHGDHRVPARYTRDRPGPARTSIPRAVSRCRYAVPPASSPTHPTMATFAPAAAAATAWLAPLPPASRTRPVPSTVSPGRGCRSTRVTRSTLSDPSTTTRPVTTARHAVHRAQPEVGDPWPVGVEGDVDHRRSQAVRVVGQAPAPVTAVDDRAAAGPRSGELHPHRETVGVDGIRVEEHRHRAGVTDGGAVVGEPAVVERDEVGGQPGGRRATRAECADLCVGDHRCVEDVEAVHRDRYVAHGTGVEDDRRGLGVVEHVELCCCGGVADVGTATHEGHPADPAERLRVHPGEEGQVGHRRQRHDGDPADPLRAPRRWCHAGGPAHSGGRAPGSARARPRSAIPSAPWTWRASTGSSRSGRAAPTPTGTSARSIRLEDGQGVPDDVRQWRVAGDAGHRAEVEARVQAGEEQRARVVHTGVDVEDDGEARHGHDHRGCRGSSAHVPLLLSARRRRSPAFGGRGVGHVPSSGACADDATPPCPPAPRPDLRSCSPLRSPRAPAAPAPRSTTDPIASGSPATSAPVSTTPSPTASPDPAAACVAETVESLTAEQRRGQLLMVGLRRQCPARRPRRDHRGSPTSGTSSTSAGGTGPTR